MLASLLLIAVLAILVLPGVLLGHSRLPLSPRVLLKVFWGHVLMFGLLGVICKLWPMLFDPRLHLW